jgi:CRP/FNR family transcriptional regulator, cyclic AMP receptor protein
MDFAYSRSSARSFFGAILTPPIDAPFQRKDIIMRALVDQLGQQLFFKDMQPAHLAVLADCAAHAEFAADKVVFETDAAADYFYIVIRGRLVLEVPGNQGQWQAVQAIEPGEVVGWSWLVPPHRWRYRGRAAERTQVIAMDGRALRQHCDADGELGYDLLRRFVQVMALRLEASRRHLEPAER